MSKIVYVPGVWDLLHFGHLQYLRHAALHGDKLVVGVQSDASVEKQKGRPPIIPQEQREQIIFSLGIVDDIMIYDELDHCAMLTKISADVLVLSTEDQSEHGRAAMQGILRLGGEYVHLGRTPGVSTTDIRRRVFDQEVEALGTTTQPEDGQ